MNFDLRFPIGILFTLFGVILVVFGFSTTSSDIYKEHSLGININLIWGAILLIFGLFMLILAWRGSSAKTRVENPS
jgi:hypothetical protein